jgi:hypothetical protein
MPQLSSADAATQAAIHTKTSFRCKKIHIGLPPLPSWPPLLKLKPAPSNYIDSQTAEVFRTTLIEMGHPQPPTPIKTGNSTAYRIVNSSIRQRRSRAVDHMRFYWVRDRVRQNHFLVYWKPGQENLGDYFTKHHQIMRSTYLQVTQAAPCSTAHKPNSV